MSLSYGELDSDAKVIVALDFFSESDTLAFVDKIDTRCCRLKIGKQLFTATGPKLVRRLVDSGCEIFLDLKFHDIPSTVERACRSAVELGVWMLNVHALGGGKMMDAARAGVDSSSCKLIAVTLLTSADQLEMSEVGLVGTPDMLVVRLAALAKQYGMDGVVCAAGEAPLLRRHISDEFCLVTPGIRLLRNPEDDQKRILTPRQAIASGSDYLVIGRPITQAEDPAAVLETINRELDLQRHR